MIAIVWLLVLNKDKIFGTNIYENYDKYNLRFSKFWQNISASEADHQKVYMLIKKKENVRQN